LKTRHPLILTARIAEKDLQTFDRLRRAHFPPDRNFLHAHLTMFHRLPGEYSERIVASLEQAAGGFDALTAAVTGPQHLGAGVAYSINCQPLQDIRTRLRAEFVSWLGPQDMQKWQPHITIQNKAPKAKADQLYHELRQSFWAYEIEITGLDLWEYLGGPWRHATFALFQPAPGEK
jgi:2'-5' RNA ligase